MPCPGGPAVAGQWCPEAEEMVSEDEINSRVAAGKAISFLMKMESIGYVGVETDSVYGAAVAIPQVARSVGWGATMTALTIRSYLFLILNLALQGFLLSTLNQEAHLMNPYAGQMHLCDFGATAYECSVPGNEDAVGCKGPGGTDITLPRLYGYTTWSTRVFVRDALKKLFPEKEKEIAEYSDPGEYGLENYYCRLVCCLIFMMGVVDDLYSSISLAFLLYHVPSRPEVWIKYDPPSWVEGHGSLNVDHLKCINNWSELHLVKFQVAGMPLFWKGINFCIVLVPKLFIWYTLVSSGFHFLMETAGIEDVIVNCMALAFILSIDEMMFERLATVATKHMMKNLEAMALFETHEEENEAQDDVLRRFHRDELGAAKYRILWLVFPRRLAIILLLMAVFVFRYYREHCVRGEDGSWVSQPMYLPQVSSYNPFQYVSGGLLPEAASPFWTMPGLATHESQESE